MCTVLLPPGGYPIAVKNVSYRIIFVITDNETRSSYKQYPLHHPVFGLYEIQLRTLYLA